VNRFYLYTWVAWGVRLTIEALLLAFVFAAIITVYLYFSRDFSLETSEQLHALLQLFMIWFRISFTLSLLIALFRSVKYILNRCQDGRKFVLLECQKDEKSSVIEEIGYGDLMKVWRKWLVLMIWLVGAEMIVATLFTTAWFQLFWIYCFIIVAGYFSFIFLSSRCSRVRSVTC